jgi:hypothetical protein
MKKILFAALAAGCLAFGCSKNTADSQTPGGGGDGDGVPCAQEIALECPEGQVDACLQDPEAASHVCVEQAGGGIGTEPEEPEEPGEDATEGGESAE